MVDVANVLDAVRVRAALQPDTLITVDELALVVPRGMLDWVREQVDPCSVVEGQELYEWADVRGMLANPPRPKTVAANKKRRARKSPGEPQKRGHLTVLEAAAELGISDRTLRKRLLDENVHLVRGGPVDVSTGRYKHWRFPATTLHEWWREVNTKVEPGAKPKRRRRPRAKPRTSQKRRIDWSAVARGEEL